MESFSTVSLEFVLEGGLATEDFDHEIFWCEQAFYLFRGKAQDMFYNTI